METTLRYVMTVALAALVTLSAFYLMHRLIDQKAGTVPILEPVTSIYFGPVDIPELKPDRIIRQPPDRPEPQDQPPPPDDFAIAKIESVRVPVQLDPTPRAELGEQIYTGSRSPTASGESASARPTVTVPPPYPRQAAVNGIEGWVQLELLIGADGRVLRTTVLASSPARVFDEAAIRAVQRWTWSPAIVAGRAVEQTVVQRLDFSLD